MGEKKLHYKMYKDGKKFVFAAIATFSILVAGGLSTVEVHADTVSENTSTATASSTSDMKSAAPSTAKKILNHLRLSWSPGMIAHEFKLATKSIYNWLNQGRIDFSLNDLPEHGVRQRRNVDQRSKYNQSLGRSIEQRPMMINQRNRIGDFELDTVVGPRGHSKAVLLTLIDRKSRFLWAYRLKDRTTATVNEALTKFLTTFNGPVHSFTVDFKQIKQDLKLEDVENGDLIHVGDEDYTKEQMEAAEEVVAKWDFKKQNYFYLVKRMSGYDQRQNRWASSYFVASLLTSDTVFLVLALLQFIWSVSAL
ncbi:IS30 family transposase [Levilactobacillus brevis]